MCLVTVAEEIGGDGGRGGGDCGGLIVEGGVRTRRLLVFYVIET